MSDQKATIYARAAAQPSIDDIVARVRAVVPDAEWHARLGSERGRPLAWTSGFFTLGDARRPEVSVTTEVMEDFHREELESEFSQQLDGTTREHLTSAARLYTVIQRGDASERLNQLFVAVVSAIAELIDGLVLDVNAGRFSRAGQYGRRRGGAAGGSGA